MPIQEYPFGSELPQSWLQKFKRAEDHLVAIDSAIKWFLNAGACQMATERDTETHHHRILGKSVFAIPLTVPLTVGDCVGNFRAALDHHWQAILERAKVETTTRTQFPIFHTEPKTENALKAWRDQLGKVPAPLETLVKGLQPYARGPSAQQHPLFHLNELVRRDKHKTLSLLVMGSLGPQLQGPAGGVAMPPLKRLENGAVLLEYGEGELTSIGAFKPGTKVEVRLYPNFQIAFREPPAVADREVMVTLVRIRDEVANVFQVLSAFTAPVPPDG